MPGRSDIFRAAAIVALIAVAIAALVAVNRRTSVAVVDGSSVTTSPASNGLAAELRRCSKLGLHDAEAAHCAAVWQENRRRFFGRPALPVRSPSSIAAPATGSPGGAR